MTETSLSGALNDKAKRNVRELAIRVASAVVLIPVVLLITLHGGWAFLLMLSVGIALLSIEWGLMVAPKLAARVTGTVTLSALAPVFTAYLGYPVLAIVMLAFGAACAGVYARHLKLPWLDTSYGALYIGWPALVLIWMHEAEQGVYWVFFTFLIAWASDSAAYVVGKVVGGPKLWRKYSPNKTWAGFAGGIIAGMLVAGTLSEYLFSKPVIGLLVGLLASLATMGGDLWESMLKRRYGIKDSGHLIPGHGGLMDRVDGLMFAIVAVGFIRLLVELGIRL